MKKFFKILFILNFVALVIIGIWGLNSHKLKNLFKITLVVFLVHYVTRTIVKEILNKKWLDKQVAKVFVNNEPALPKKELMKRSGLAEEIINRRYGHQEIYSQKAYRVLIKKI